MQIVQELKEVFKERDDTDVGEISKETLEWKEEVEEQKAKELVEEVFDSLEREEKHPRFNEEDVKGHDADSKPPRRKGYVGEEKALKDGDEHFV